MPGKHAFKLRDHGHKIIEMIVEDHDIKSSHESMKTLPLLTRKFESIIFTLSEDASLNEEVLPIVLKVGEFGALKIVAEAPEKQMPFDSHGIMVFNDVFEAVNRIKGERTAEVILKQLGKLGAIKSKANDVLQIMRNPEVKFEDIEDIISQDPQLVASMLKTANTAYFSRRVPVETLSSAVTYLGLEGIRQLLLHEMFASFSQLFANQRDRLAHMRRCSHLAAYIGKLTKSNIPTIGKIRVAGLMHDIGSLAYAFYDEQKYAQVLRMVRGEKMSVAEAEHKVFGVDHTYLGALYAREIGMPDYVISVIKQHHSVEADSEDMVLNAVVGANGFLNERIEQIPCADFDHIFSFIAQKINENDPAYKASAAKNDEAAGEESEDEETEELVEELQAGFKPMQLYGLLKEELDQFMMSGASAQGF